MKKRRTFLAALALASVAATAQPPAVTDGLMTDQNGRTLYTFAYDGPGKSNCNFACTVAWYPYRASASERGEGRLSIVERPDGIRQWAIDGRPLYLYTGDVQPRDVKGDLPGYPWHVLRLSVKLEVKSDPAR